MASISSLGSGSGLDLQGILDKLMAVEQQPLTVLAQKESAFQAKLSAFGSLKGALSAIQTAAATLASTDTFGGVSAAVSDSSILNATTTSGAATGNYSVSVEQLAQAQMLRSNTNFAATTDTFNTGTIAISVGGAAPQNVTITSSNNTLAGIRDAINAAGVGVTASVVNDGTTNRLLLSANATGLTAGAISVAVTDAGSGGTHALSTLDGASLVEVMPPRDAHLTVNGLAITRSSNTISDVITGVTLNLTKAGTIGSPVTTQVNLTRNTTAIQGAITTFVGAYNAALTQMKSFSAYDADNKAASVLTGDSTLRSIQTQLSNLFTGSVSGLSGNISRLSDIGISVQKDGSLLIDTAKLPAAINDTSKDVAGLFTSTADNNKGLAVRINTALDGMISATGLITSRTDGITQSIKTLDSQRDALTLRLTAIEAKYRAQFTALDTTISSMQQTQSYLTQQLSYLKSLAVGNSNN